MNHKFNACPWLADMLQPETRKEIVNRCVKFLRRYQDKFDFIAYRGMSGAMIAGPVAYRLNKPTTVIRKPDENKHSNNNVEGMLTGRYIILDDFISSGETVESIMDALPGACCIFMYMYRNPEYLIHVRRAYAYGLKIPVCGQGNHDKGFKALLNLQFNSYQPQGEF